MTFLHIRHQQLTPIRRFRWVHCQIETLRRCFTLSIRQILDGLPQTLDETYERILLEIDDEKQVYANRLFQCLATSIRPLGVEELAEIFAVLPNAGSTPDFNVNWRPEDPEAFILSACSTLVTIVNTQGGRKAQFSHFSVKEYLTSDRIANSACGAHFQVLPKAAHTLLARACLGVLLQLDDSIDETKINNLPLALYAAEYWVYHARFEDVLSDIGDGVDRLLDKDKPHFGAWLWVFNIETRESMNWDTDDPEEPTAVPLYYAAYCGFRGLVERLLELYPQDLDAEGGEWGTPLGAAIIERHLDIVQLLLEQGADGETCGEAFKTGLYVASCTTHADNVRIVRTLLDRGANPNAVCEDWESRHEDVEWTPLHAAVSVGRQETVRVLLDYGADINHPDSLGKSPLHIASYYSYDSEDLVQLLLDHGANLGASDDFGLNALHEASSSTFGKEAVGLLLDSGLDANGRSKERCNPLNRPGLCIYSDSEGWTPLHYAAYGGVVEAAQVLLDYDADINTPDEDHWTPLHLAAFKGHPQVVDTLLQRGANPHARTIEGHTPLELTSTREWQSRENESRDSTMQLLSEHTGLIESGYGPQ